MTLTRYQKAGFRHHLHSSNDVRDAVTGEISTGLELSADELAAVTGAATPSAANVFATMTDVGGGVTPAANVAAITNTPSATPQAVAEKVNALITALINAGLMEAPA